MQSSFLAGHFLYWKLQIQKPGSGQNRQFDEAACVFFKRLSFIIIQKGIVCIAEYADR